MEDTVPGHQEICVPKMKLANLLTYYSGFLV